MQLTLKLFDLLALGDALEAVLSALRTLVVGTLDYSLSKLRFLITQLSGGLCYPGFGALCLNQVD